MLWRIQKHKDNVIEDSTTLKTIVVEFADYFVYSFYFLSMKSEVF